MKYKISVCLFLGEWGYLLLSKPSCSGSDTCCWSHPLTPTDFKQSHFRSMSKNKTHGGVIFDTNFWKREKWQIKRQRSHRQTRAKIIGCTKQCADWASTLSKDSYEGQEKQLMFLSSPSMYILQSFSKHLKRKLKIQLPKFTQIIQY